MHIKSSLATSQLGSGSRCCIAVLGAAVLTAFMGVGGFGLQGLPEAQAQAKTFNQGHIDAFNVTSSGKGNLKLDLKEDVTGQHVQRDPNEVTLKVNKEAYEPKVETVEGIGVPAYYLPLSQKSNLIWPGWDTQGAAAHYKNVDINFKSVCGPGRVFMWTSQFGTDVKPLLKDGLQVKSGNAINQPYPAHVHANWAFERPGRYSMQVQASADGVKSETKTYTWVVEKNGSDANADQPANGANPCGNDSSGGSGQTGGGNQGGHSNNNGPSNDNESDQSKQSNQSNDAGEQSPGGAPVLGAPDNDHGSGDSGSSDNSSDSAAPAGGANAGAAGAEGAHECKKGEPALRPLIKDDRKQPPKWTAPSELNFGLGNAAKTNLPQALGPVGKGQAWMIGSTQSNGVPWVGVNTMHPDLLANTNGDVTFALTSFNGPGSMYVFEQGNLGQVVGKEWFKASGGNPSGSHVVPRNSHVHPNWVFSKPGTYKVGITQTATTKQGKKISAPATLTFTVGGSGNANSGHFDFGSTVTMDGDCAAGGAGGAGADGSSASASGAGGSLADTGSTSAMLALGIAGAGLIALGAGVVYMLRTNALSTESISSMSSMAGSRTSRGNGSGSSASGSSARSASSRPKGSKS